MSDILCVTKRSLCKEDFLVRIEKIAKTEAAGIILREKDLSKEEYQALAEKVLAICQRQKMQCILHTYTNVARKLACNAIHLPMPILRTLSKEERDAFQILGASCHSLKEAVEAGADIIMLDNMSTEEMQEAIKIIDGRAEVECSGNVTKENIGRLTALGVDYISSGALTHSAPILDISMKNLHAVE